MTLFIQMSKIQTHGKKYEFQGTTDRRSRDLEVPCIDQREPPHLIPEVLGRIFMPNIKAEDHNGR